MELFQQIYDDIYDVSCIINVALIQLAKELYPSVDSMLREAQERTEARRRLIKEIEKIQQVLELDNPPKDVYDLIHWEWSRGE